MEVIIKTYEPGKDFEKIQADIYNQAVKKYNGRQVTPEEIINRIETFTPAQDTNGIFFAFSKDNRPLSYIQYRIYETDKLFIGHAWSVDDCSKEVQHKMYEKIITYVKTKYPDKKEVYLGYILDDFTDIVNFIKSEGFKLYNSITTYSVDLVKLSKLQPDKNFSFREATMNDLDILVSLGLDSNLKAMGESSLRNYFKDKPLKDGNCVILFENDKAVASTAILNGYFEGKESLARFIALREGYNESQKSLFIHLAGYLLKKGLFLPIRVEVDKRNKLTSEFIFQSGKIKESESAYVKSI